MLTKLIAIPPIGRFSGWTWPIA